MRKETRPPNAEDQGVQDPEAKAEQEGQEERGCSGGKAMGRTTNAPPVRLSAGDQNP